MTPNLSVLQCPECQKPLVNIGSKVERIHPVARFIRERSTTIVMVWLPFIPLIMYLTSLVAGDLGGDRVIVFCFFALLLLPFAVNFFCSDSSRFGELLIAPIADSTRSRSWDGARAANFREGKRAALRRRSS